MKISVWFLKSLADVNFCSYDNQQYKSLADTEQNWKLQRSLSPSGLSVVVEKLDESTVQKSDSSHLDEDEECPEGDESIKSFSFRINSNGEPQYKFFYIPKFGTIPYM